MENSFNLRFSLFLLRISVFLVLLMWTLDKFVRPGHAAAVYANFYKIPDLSHIWMIVFGAIELVFILGFLIGIYKTFTYGFVFVIHLISTLSSFKQYATPFVGAHLLFYAAWPMLAACYMLFVLRKHDTFLTFAKRRLKS